MGPAHQAPSGRTSPGPYLALVLTSPGPHVIVILAWQVLSWYEVLVSHRQLSYAETHRLTGFMAASLHAGRFKAAMAVLHCLNEQTKRQESIAYVSGVLLCVSAILCLNSSNIATYGAALSLLRATLDRVPGGATAELTTMQLIKRPPPPPLELSTNIYEKVTIEDKARAYAFDPEPSWKSRLLQEALDAQLGIWQRRAAESGRPAPSADELLRMLLLRGGSLAESRDDTIWLISELRAIYGPHLPPCDQMGVAHLWLLLLQACTTPLKPKADAACERAYAWLMARGDDFVHLRETFEQLHSSGQRAGAAYAWAATGKRNAKAAEESWRAPLTMFLNNLKRLFADPEQQQRAFGTMVEACCVWLILQEPEPLPPPKAVAAALAAVAEAEKAAALDLKEEEEEEEEEGDEASAQRWAALSMLGALLAEFPGFWTQEQHAATSELLSSAVFLMRNPAHATKLREDMQFLVNDPPAGEVSNLFFVHPQVFLTQTPTPPLTPPLTPHPTPYPLT